MSRTYDPMRISALLLVILVTPACRQDQAPAEERLRAVRTEVVEAGGSERIRTFSGTTRSSQQSRLSFKVAGTLASLRVNVGDRLERGDLIATLVPDQYELRAQRAEADLAQARANLRNAEATYERTKELWADNNAARGDLDASRAAAESAQAQVRAAERQLELARLELSYTRLPAATDCSVATVEAEVNENVGVGAPVVTVNCGDQLEVGLDIPEGLVGELRPGMPASVRFDALGDTEYAGTVSEISVTTRDGATFPVTVSLDPASSGALRAGLAAEVTLRLGDDDDGDTTVRIPLSAVVEIDGQSYVYLAEPEGSGEAVVTRRQVTLGELGERGLEIRTGLEPGDLLITAGAAVIRDGMRVLLDAGPVADEGQGGDGR